MSADAIRQARAASNQAIADRDPDAIASLLLPTYHIVTARNAQRSSRDESRASWAALFRDDPLASTYVRTPHDIQVNEESGSAHESGTWTGATHSGVYAAKWQRTPDGRWMLQAELFTAL